MMTKLVEHFFFILEKEGEGALIFCHFPNVFFVSYFYFDGFLQRNCQKSSGEPSVDKA